jgi:hypothetical protein
MIQRQTAKVADSGSDISVGKPIIWLIDDAVSSSRSMDRQSR